MIMQLKLILTCIASVLLVQACSISTPSSNSGDNTGIEAITLSGFEQHVKTIASDEFEGRKPFTKGEEKTLAYLQKALTDLGIEQGNGNSYLQEVPMVEITAITDSIMQVKSPKEKFNLRGFHDFTLNTERTESTITWKDEELVFAGFGVVAPEYNWDDYQGLDVKGKIVIVLVNDPGFGSTDSTFFKGNTMTYYGRWTYKYEEAARQGAKGCFVVHNTVPAGYPFAVLQNNWNSAHLYLDERGQKTNYCEGIGWLTKDATERLFRSAGKNLNEEQTKARQKGYKGFSLNTTISTSMKVTSRYNRSYNVIGKITGKKTPEEYLMYMAHWDHLGIGREDESGDSIYNGAYDNASGTAGVLEIAKAFKSLKEKPDRTIVFTFLTAEEQGLWGSAYYAKNPVYPKEKTIGVINMDGVNPFGKMKDVMIVGVGQSDLEDVLKNEAKGLQRDVNPDGEPEKGSYFRSDHFNMAKIGIPSLYIKPGNSIIGKSDEEGRQFKDTYVQKYYHQPSDEFDPSRVNFEGAVDDLQLLYLVGKRLAFGSQWPKWKASSEFRQVRESYLK
jgi:Zn-dependent M28 family amino/carboxypeptidase